MKMKIYIWIISFLMLVGCSNKPTTAAEAEKAIKNCGMSPTDLSWTVSDDGSFAFGRKSPKDPGPSFQQTECLTKWAKENRVKLGFIGWESVGNPK
jgi:hypothetical protein